LNSTKAKYVEASSNVAPGRPRFPKKLSPDAKRFFKNLTRTLEARKTLTEGDQQLLRLAAILLDRHERSMDHVLEEGEICTYTRTDSNGAQFEVVKENLWLRCAKDAEKQLVAVLDRLGLTPMNRGKIKPAEPPKEASPEQAAEDALMSRESASEQRANEEPNLDDIDLSKVN
jgi:P27 family predicted phage terminase small subunit